MENHSEKEMSDVNVFFEKLLEIKDATRKVRREIKLQNYDLAALSWLADARGKNPEDDGAEAVSELIKYAQALGLPIIPFEVSEFSSSENGKTFNQKKKTEEDNFPGLETKCHEGDMADPVQKNKKAFILKIIFQIVAGICLSFILIMILR